MKIKMLFPLLIAFMAIILVACGGSGMVEVAVEPAAGAAIAESTTQVIESDSRRAASTVSTSQAEVPVREPATDTPVPTEVPIEPTVEPTATLAPVPTETPVPTEIPNDEVSVQFVVNPPKAVLHFLCISDGTEQQVVLTDFETAVPLDSCDSASIEITELSGEMTLAVFTITREGGGTTSLTRYLYRLVTNLPEGSRLIAEKKSGEQYYSGAILALSCEDGSTTWQGYVFIPGVVQVPEFYCAQYWGKVETWEGMFTFTHKNGEIVTIPTLSKNSYYFFDTPLAEWSIEYSQVPLGQ